MVSYFKRLILYPEPLDVPPDAPTHSKAPDGPKEPTLVDKLLDESLDEDVSDAEIRRRMVELYKIQVRERKERAEEEKIRVEREKAEAWKTAEPDGVLKRMGKVIVGFPLGVVGLHHYLRGDMSMAFMFATSWGLCLGGWMADVVMLVFQVTESEVRVWRLVRTLYSVAYLTVMLGAFEYVVDTKIPFIARQFIDPTLLVNVKLVITVLALYASEEIGDLVAAAGMAFALLVNTGGGTNDVASGVATRTFRRSVSIIHLVFIMMLSGNLLREYYVPHSRRKYSPRVRSFMRGVMLFSGIMFMYAVVSGEVLRMRAFAFERLSLEKIYGFQF